MITACGSSESGTPCARPAQNAKQADARIRTGDPFITSEVLYQLSYVGGAAESSDA